MSERHNKKKKITWVLMAYIFVKYICSRNIEHGAEHVGNFINA